jgi:hypothetical protein
MSKTIWTALGQKGVEPESPKNSAVQLLAQMIGCFPATVQADWAACESMVGVIT